MRSLTWEKCWFPFTGRKSCLLKGLCLNKQKYRTNLLFFFLFVVFLFLFLFLLLLLISIIVPAKNPHEGGSEHLIFRLCQCFLQTQCRLLLTNMRNHSGQSRAKLKLPSVTCGDGCGVHVRRLSSCVFKKQSEKKKCQGGCDCSFFHLSTLRRGAN